MNLIREITKEEMLNTLEYAINNNFKGGSHSSLSQVKNLVYDWNIESGWDNDSHEILGIVDKGIVVAAVACNYTKLHISNRHIYVLESERGKNLAYHLKLEQFKNAYDRGMLFHRNIANKTSNLFHIKTLHQRPWGITKNNQLFFYYPINDRDMIKNNKTLIQTPVEEIISGINKSDVLRTAFDKQLSTQLRRNAKIFDENELKQIWNGDIRGWKKYWNNQKRKKRS